MDQDGPGAIVRFWATWHGPGGGLFSNGTLRFYLDNNPTPVIEGPAASIIDEGALCTGPLSEGVSPKTEPRWRGHNLYLPIPYAKHCKVTYQTDVLMDIGAREGEALYYQINYRTYDAGTTVESFAMNQLEQHKDKLAAAQERLLKSGIDAVEGGNGPSFAGPLAAGKTRSAQDRPAGSHSPADLEARRRQSASGHALDDSGDRIRRSDRQCGVPWRRSLAAVISRTPIGPGTPK